MFQLCTTLLVLLQACNSFAHIQSNDFLVCKPIGSLFEMQHSSTGGSSTPLRGSPGPPGRRGPRGLPGISGPIGPTGPQATIDWNRIEQRIDLKIKELSICPGVTFNGSCYWLPMTIAAMNKGKGKAAAEALCAFYNGTLVDIESKEMFNKLQTYIQHAWNLYFDQPTYNTVEIWTALTYVNGELRSSTGGNVYASWHSGSPTSGPTQAVIWNVPKNQKSTNFGMWTYTNLFHTTAIPFCRIQTN